MEDAEGLEGLGLARTAYMASISSSSFRSLLSSLFRGWCCGFRVLVSFLRLLYSLSVLGSGSMVQFGYHARCMHVIRCMHVVI